MWTLSQTTCASATLPPSVRKKPPGMVHHSDRGAQYASANYRADLDRIDAVPSMSRKGNCWDNAVFEARWAEAQR